MGLLGWWEALVKRWEEEIQVGALLLALCIPLSCIVLNFCCLFNPWLWWFYIPYVIWIFIDKAPYTSGRPVRWMRRCSMWKYFRSYFPVKLIVDESLSADKQYFFVVHPHGIMSLGVWATFASDGCSKQMPGINLRILTVSANFRVPFWRDFLLGMGLIDASRDSVSRILSSSKNLSVMVIAGGAAESLDARPRTNILTLHKRKGFVRLALLHGVPLVPVFSFGENDLYDQVANPTGSFLRRWQTKMLSTCGWTMPLFKGRGIVLPYRHPVYTVVGKPIEIPHIANPSEKDIEQYHAQYVAALEQLYNNHKSLLKDEAPPIEIN